MSQALSKIRATSLPRRGLSREEAAMYIGISGSTFDQMRADGLIEPPRLIGGRVARTKGSDFDVSCECSGVCSPFEDCIPDALLEVVEWLTASLKSSTCSCETPP